MNGHQLKQNIRYDIITCISNRVIGYKNPKITKIYNELLNAKGLHHLVSRKHSDIFQVNLSYQDHQIYHSNDRNFLDIFSIVYESFENLIKLMNYLGLDIEYFATNLLDKECLSRLLLIPDTLVEVLNEAVTQIKNKMEKD